MNCTNLVDDDGDGYVDCNDADCYATASCRDPGCLQSCPACPRPEQCANQVDDDCDGHMDCRDANCRDAPACSECFAEDCDDGEDNDCDDLTDCGDPDCAPVC
jgi:hypothetical protein